MRRVLHGMGVAQGGCCLGVLHKGVLHNSEYCTGGCFTGGLHGVECYKDGVLHKGLRV